VTTRFSPGSRPVQVQLSRGLAALVGTAEYPTDCPNSGWVDQAWVSKLVGWGGGFFKQQRSVEALTAENDYHDNCRALWERRTVVHCPRWWESKSRNQGYT